MAPDTELKECSYFLVRYVPDLVRDESLNIGLLLHSPEEEYLDCLFTDALKRHGVLDHRLFEKRIPARQWTGEGDPFTFDYGYRSLRAARKPNGHIKLIHALSLKRDPDVADLLGIKIRRVREKEPAELTAVVEALPSAADEVAFYSHRVLLEHEIAIQPLAAVDGLALSVRRELSA